ncbi:helix-turn-helix domain-containing protein [Frigidibacter sp. MR17.24]|uniref:helix-turn-helix domain-containing protein n=1 Tax=Frigidibacter sp. MR17.24 TaxID=3127345 RepID=UPI003012A34F
MLIERLGMDSPETGRALALGRLTIRRDRLAAPERLHQPSGPGSDGYALVIPCRGALRFHHADRTGEVAEGGYLLLDRARFFAISGAPAQRFWSVSLPAEETRLRIPAIEDHLAGRCAQDPQMARLLARMIETTATLFHAHPPAQPEALAAEIVALVALVLRAETVPAPGVGRTGRARTRHRIMRYIAHHLADPDLRPAQLARTHGISVSHLHALFADTGTTVGNYIQSSRLQAAYEILVAEAGHGLTVSEAAFRTGFKSVPHFSRSFSRRFGLPPTAMRTAAAATLPAKSRFRDAGKMTQERS